jgi:mycothiol synthase
VPADEPTGAAHDDVVLHRLVADDAPEDPDAVADAVGLLDAAAGAGHELVDEAEERRLRQLHATGEVPPGWHAVLARRDDHAVGYAGLVAPSAAGGDAVGDVAVARAHPPVAPVLAALLATATDLARTAGAARLQVWMRHASEDAIAHAVEAGFTVERRLGVLGRDLPLPGDGSDDTAPPEGITIRASRPGADDERIVAVLAAAYGTGPDGGWDLARFRERRQLPWFRPEDVLLAVDEDERVLGLHWLKRRSATVGEVHNLAVHPDGQGRGLGPALLRAGLDHLTGLGCHEVLLWVDRANQRAVQLYTSQGMTTRWDDVALGRTLRREAGPT